MIEDRRQTSQSGAKAHWNRIRVRQAAVGGAPERERDGYECAKCELIVAGAPVSRMPERCPVCVAREGKAVAIVAAENEARLSMMVIDRRLLALIDNYRRAKREHERQVVASQLIQQLGSYDTDDPILSEDIEESASREQRAALALADAAVSSRPSSPSLH